MKPESWGSDDGSTALGGWVTIDSPVVIDVMSRAGFDYLCIDAQHSLIGIQEAVRLLYVVDRAVPVLVRVPGNDPAGIGKLLDCGANGIIVPMVDTVDDAIRASRACVFAPDGLRSFGPIRGDLPRSRAGLTERVSCFVMIETAVGAGNARQIAAVPGVSGLYLGPADLAISLGLEAGDWGAPVVQQAAREVVAACRSAGKLAAGHAVSIAQARDMIAMGMDMVSLVSDKSLIAEGARAGLAALRISPVRP